MFNLVSLTAVATPGTSASVVRRQINMCPCKKEEDLLTCWYSFSGKSVSFRCFRFANHTNETFPLLVCIVTSSCPAVRHQPSTNSLCSRDRTGGHLGRTTQHSPPEPVSQTSGSLSAVANASRLTEDFSQHAGES